MNDADRFQIHRIYGIVSGKLKQYNIVDYLDLNRVIARFRKNQYDECVDVCEHLNKIIKDGGQN